MQLQYSVSVTHDRRSSGICMDEVAAIDVDVGMAMIAQQVSYTRRYYANNTLYEDPGPYENINGGKQFN